MNRIRTVVLAVLLVMATLAVPGVGFAQDDDGDCYPPASPECEEERGRSPAAVECDLDAPAREVECAGEGFEPGSTVELELRRTGATAMAPMAAIGPVVLAQSDGNVVASSSTTVEEDGTFDVGAELPCDYDDDRVLARVSGTDDQGRSATFTEQVDVSEAEPCDATVLSGSQERSGAAGGDGAGWLPRTGTDWLLLIAAALALLAVGTWLVRRRREGGSPQA